MGFRLQAGDFLVGTPLRELPGQIKKLSLLFCAVERRGEVSIPNGDFQFGRLWAICRYL